MEWARKNDLQSPWKQTELLHWAMSCSQPSECVLGWYSHCMWETMDRRIFKENTITWILPSCHSPFQASIFVFLCCVARNSGCVSLTRWAEWPHQSIKALGSTHVYNCSARQHLYIFITTHGHHLPQFCQTLFFQKSGNFIRAYFRDEAELCGEVTLSLS